MSFEGHKRAPGTGPGEIKTAKLLQLRLNSGKRLVVKLPMLGKIRGRSLLDAPNHKARVAAYWSTEVI